MSSKQLESILRKSPSATVNEEIRVLNENKTNSAMFINHRRILEKKEKIVAYVPKKLKEEIKLYVQANEGETESSVVLRALKQIGFYVPQEYLGDQRRNR